MQGQLRKTAYNWKISVFLDGNEIIFEPDDDGNLRAVIVDETVFKKIDSSLVKAISWTHREKFHQQNVKDNERYIL